MNALVDVGDVDAKAARLQVGINAECTEADVTANLLAEITCEHDKKLIADLIVQLFTIYRKLYRVCLKTVTK